MRLAVLKGCREQKDVNIEVLPFIVGRCRTASFIIPHVNVSRNHCRIFRDDFSWKLEDFSSSGTYVNNTLVGKDKTIVLNEKDVIRLGSPGNNLEWTFISFQTSNSAVENIKSPNTSTFRDQSRKLIDLHVEKCDLEERIYKNNILQEKKIHEEKKLNEKCKKYFKKTETEQSSKVETIDFSDKNKKQTEGKENSCINLQNELDRCSSEIVEIENENKKLISHLMNVQRKVQLEMTQLDSCFQLERNKLETEIKQMQIKICERSNLSEKDTSDKLKEQDILIEKLNALEEAQKILFLKLEKANTFNLKSKTSEVSLENVENNANGCEKVSEKFEIPQHNGGQSTENYEIDCCNVTDNSNLLQELKEVKNALSILENKNSDLEGKLKAAINKENGTLQNLTDLLETEFQCTICSELFVATVTLSCTHSFCEFCLNRWKKKQKTCPICRKKIMNENRSLVVDSYIDKMVETLSTELQDRRKALIADRNEPSPVKKPKGKRRSKSFR